MWHFKSPALRAAAAFIAIATLGACGERGPLDEETLARQLRALSSLSAQAAFVAQQIRAGHLRSSVIAVHLHDLGEDTEHAREAIARAGPAPLEARRLAAQERARELAQALRRIGQEAGGNLDPLLAHEQENAQRLKGEFDALEKHA